MYIYLSVLYFVASLGQCAYSQLTNDLEMKNFVGPIISDRQHILLYYIISRVIEWEGSVWVHADFCKTPKYKIKSLVCLIVRCYV